MSMCFFRSPFVAAMLAVILSIIVSGVATAVADDVGDGDCPDPTDLGLWSRNYPPVRVSSVSTIVWLNFGCMLILVA